MLRLAGRALLDGERRHLRVVVGTLEHVDFGHEPEGLQQGLVGLRALLEQRVQQLLPVFVLRVVRHQPLERPRRAVRVVQLDAGAQQQLQGLVLGRLTFLGLAVHHAFLELQGALPVALEVVRLAHEREHLVIRIARLDGASAELDGLVVVLQPIVKLRDGLDARGNLRLAQETVVELRLDRLHGVRLVFRGVVGSARQHVDDVLIVRRLLRIALRLLELGKSLGILLRVQRVLCRLQRLGELLADLLLLGGICGLAGHEPRGTHDCGAYNERHHQAGSDLHNVVSHLLLTSL